MAKAVFPCLQMAKMQNVAYKKTKTISKKCLTGQKDEYMMKMVSEGCYVTSIQNNKNGSLLPMRVKG